MATFGDRLKNSWNAFMGRDPTEKEYSKEMYSYGSFGSRPDRVRLSPKNMRSIVSIIYNKIAVDVAAVNIHHVRLDENDKYLENIKGPLDNIFNLRANMDQTGRAFIQDLVMSMFDEGCIAIVPVITDIDPTDTESFTVYNARVGKIVEWFPKHIRVEVYNELRGQKQQIVIEKALCPIIENPFYTIMNEPNSTAQRLIRLLNQIDRTNEQNSAGKIDLLVQLPYAVKSKAKKDIADERRKDLEEQLTNSQYGIGYIDASERVIQLNRSVENNFWTQAQDLLVQLYNQLGVSEAVINGTADEQTMLNYQSQTIEPILSAITIEVQTKWLSQKALSTGQAIKFFKDPFKLVPVGKIADIADKFTRNCIMTANEMRAVIGLKPASDPKADELRNANLNHPDENGKESIDIEETETIE